MDRKPFEYVSLEQNISGGLTRVKNRRLVETAAGTEIIIHLRRPDILVTEELTKFVIVAYNQVAAG